MASEQVEQHIQPYVKSSKVVGNPKKPDPPDLAEYLDHRAYLKDFYHFKRASDKNSIRPYSYAMFSAAAGIKSPNYLKLIIEGKRNLSPTMIRNFSKALGLDKYHSEEFRLLVLYSQEKQPLQRNQYLRELADWRVQRKIERGEIDEATWEKIPSWITWVIYAMTDQKGVKFSSDELKKILRGNADTDSIKASLQKLIDSGELKENEVGEVYKARELIDAPDKVPVALVKKLQSELMYLALEALFHDQAQDREFGALTLALTQEEFEKIKFELRQFRKRIHKDILIARKSEKGERVYQLNLQFFAVTDPSS